MAVFETLTVRVVEPLRVVALRHLPGGTPAVSGALQTQGFAALPGAGQFVGSDPCLMWLKPTEWLLIGTTDAVADGLLASLAPGCHSLACAVDQSSGGILFELQGAGLPSLLPRLVDSTAVPQAAQQGSRCRLGDVAVMLLRHAADRAWLLADRSNGDYIAQWLRDAARPISA